LPRIQEVDQLLIRRPELAGRVFEAHPEVSFALMHGGEPLPAPKKVKGRRHALGLECRRQILEGQGFSAAFLGAPPPGGAALDDLYDACACAWSASRILAKQAITFPAKSSAGAIGRLAAVWA
jgi:predicted RNase H-like nuclease